MILLAQSGHAAALAKIEELQPSAAGWKKEGFESEILQSCAQIYCFFKDNQAAVALYQKAGLVILGERKDFYGPAKDAFIMGKNL